MDAGNDTMVFESSDFQSNIFERRIPSQLWLSKVLHQAVEMKPIQPSCSLFVPNMSQRVVAQLSTFPPLFSNAIKNEFLDTHTHTQQCLFHVVLGVLATITLSCATRTYNNALLRNENYSEKKLDFKV